MARSTHALSLDVLSRDSRGRCANGTFTQSKYTSINSGLWLQSPVHYPQLWLAGMWPAERKLPTVRVSPGTHIAQATKKERKVDPKRKFKIDPQKGHCVYPSQSNANLKNKTADYFTSKMGFL